LQLTVLKLNSWSKQDVLYNLPGDDNHGSDGATWYNHGQARPAAILDIETRLARIRTYQEHETDMQWTRDLENARSRGDLFDDTYILTGQDPINVNDSREFAAFYNVVRSYHADSARIGQDSSSSLKASNFTVYFMLPPFFSRLGTRFEYKE